jgi:hypothetical protein
VTHADSSHALGAPEIAGSFVNARGLGKKLGAARAGAAAAGADEGAPEIPSFGRVGYLSVAGDEIAIVRTKAGAFRTTITDVVLARVPRSAIASVVFDEGVLLSHLTIAFDNAVVWKFDIPRLNKRTAELVVRELGGIA